MLLIAKTDRSRYFWFMFWLLFVVATFFYSIVRGLYLFWNWSLYSSVQGAQLLEAFWVGLRFDLSVVSILCIPAFLLWLLATIIKKNLNWAVLLTFLFLQVPFLILNLGEIEYVQLSGRRMTLQSFAIVHELKGKVSATFAAYLPLLGISTLITFCFIFCVYLAFKKYRQNCLQRSAKSFLVLLFSFVVLLVASRGGLQKKPIGFAHTQHFTNSSLNQLCLNSSFTLIQSLNRKPLEREHYMTRDQMIALMNGRAPGESLIENLRFEKKQNVVLILVESLTLDQMGGPHQDQGYTPFLDELSRKGLLFTNSFANARRSIEGIGAALAGVPALMIEPFISSQYMANTFYGLGTVLGASGYSSAFFHGAANGSMYFDQFTRSAGIQKYYGANEYPRPEDHDGTWGIWDRPFLLETIKEIQKLKTPFVSTTFTLSSHSPFLLPTNENEIYPKGTSEIHEVMGYTDSALKSFFTEAAKQSWYSDTLFIITGDHTYKTTRAGYQNEWGQYRIPLIFFHPQIKEWPKKIQTAAPVQQIDLIPSLLDFLKIDFHPQNLMGRSVFKNGERSVLLFSDGQYFFIRGSKMLKMTGGNQVELFELPNHLAGEAAAIPLENPELKADLLQRLQAHRQYFSEGMWDNAIYR